MNSICRTTACNSQDERVNLEIYGYRRTWTSQEITLKKSRKKVSCSAECCRHKYYESRRLKRWIYGCTVEFAKFHRVFKAGAKRGWNITGILPPPAVIITVLNALITLIGEERVAKISNMQERGAHTLFFTAYCILPLQWSPTNFAMGKTYWMRNINRHIVILWQVWDIRLQD